MNPGAGPGQRPRNGEADPRSAGRYEHPLPIGIEISHVVPSPLFTQNCTVLSFDHKSNITLEGKALRGYIAIEHRKEDGTAMALTNSRPGRPQETVQDHVIAN